MLKNVEGVYRIVNLVTGMQYVGSSYNVKSRVGTHRAALNKNKHYNKALQNDWVNFGESSFEFEMLEEIHDTTQRVERENFWMSKGWETGANYNSVKAEKTGGARISSEMKRAIELIKGGMTRTSAARQVGVRVSSITNSRLYKEWVAQQAAIAQKGEAAQ